MASAASAIFPQIANFNPQGFVQGNQLQQQQLGLSAIQAQRLQQETALQAQQTQGAALQNQLTRQSIQDSGILRDAYAKHADDDWSDPQTQANFEKEIAKNGISYQGLSGYRDQTIKWRQGLQNLNEGQMKLEDTLNQRTTDILQGYKDVPDAQKPQLWAQVYAPQLNALHRGQFDPTNPLVGSSLDAVIGAVAHHKALLEEQKTAAETAGLGATQKKTEAETQATQLKTQLEQAELDLHKALVSSPQSLDNFVERSIPKAQYPQLHQAAVNEAGMTGNIKDLRGVVEKYSQDAREQEKTIAVETNPQILAAKRKQAELQASYENALRQGDEANKEYYGSAVDFNTTKAASQSIQKVVELAQSGNPLAANQLKALVPEFTNAMMDIKRLGGMQNDKNFTSAFDTAMDTASSIFKGQPFTPSTLQQIMPYVRTIANNAADKHNATVQTVNQTYKKNYQQEQRPYSDIANPKTPSGTARKVGQQVTLKGGRTITIKHVYPDGTFD